MFKIFGLLVLEFVSMFLPIEQLFFTTYLMRNRKYHEYVSKFGGYTCYWENVRYFNFFSALFYQIFNWNTKIVDSDFARLKSIGDNN